MSRTYTIEPHGKKFATVCRNDGYWSITWLSKNRKAAKRKGDDFVSGKRSDLRKYVTEYGRALNTEKSLSPRRSRAEIIAATVAAFQSS